MSDKFSKLGIANFIKDNYRQLVCTVFLSSLFFFLGHVYRRFKFINGSYSSLPDKTLVDSIKYAFNTSSFLEHYYLWPFIALYFMLLGTSICAYLFIQKEDLRHFHFATLLIFAISGYYLTYFVRENYCEYSNHICFGSFGSY